MTRLSTTLAAAAPLDAVAAHLTAAGCPFVTDGDDALVAEVPGARIRVARITRVRALLAEIEGLPARAELRQRGMALVVSYELDEARYTGTVYVAAGPIGPARSGPIPAEALATCEALHRLPRAITFDHATGRYV